MSACLVIFAEWALAEPLLPLPGEGGRPARDHERHPATSDAMIHSVETAGSGRMSGAYQRKQRRLSKVTPP
ncbi:MAG: transposase [Actinoallomurus sp.]